jgi:hypothetical protein
METRRILTILVLVLVLIVWPVEVSEAEPMGTAFGYQGHLYDTNEVANGEYDFEFGLYDSNDPCTGIQLGSTIDLNEVEVVDGQFMVALDFGGVFDGNAVWLEVGVRPGEMNDPNGYTPLSPLQEVTPVPYAMHAKTAESIAAGGYVETDPEVGAISNNYVPKWDGSALVTGTIYDNGNVGIGTTSPAARLTVNGAILRSGSTMYGNYTERHINLGTNSTTGTDGPDLYSYPTVGGGGSNEASGNCATVGGGWDNTASGATATIGGGVYNTANGASATVGGGNGNNADRYATVAGGADNQANSDYTTVGGGHYNNAGGYGPTASGHYATVPGGRSNTADGSYSFAAGRRAKANHQGSFVWADSADADFASTGNNQFLIRASGGVGIGTNSPATQLDVNGTITATGGNSVNWNTAFGWGNHALQGYLNNASALNWNNITNNMPAGFADGVDDVGGGDSDWAISDSNMYSTPSGNVGIGTTNPGTKLDVQGGDINTSGKVKEGGNNLIPSGAVMFFNLPSCPSGWSELTTARGRYLVGKPSGGTLAGTQGTALTDLENRAVGQHNHSITDPGHVHQYSSDNNMNCGSGCSHLWTGTGKSSSSSTTGITIDNEGSVSGTNAPYIQLCVCQKD